MKKYNKLLLVSLVVFIIIALIDINIQNHNYKDNSSSDAINPLDTPPIPNPYFLKKNILPNIPVTIYFNISDTFQAEEVLLSWRSTWFEWQNQSMACNETHYYANITAQPANTTVWFKLYVQDGPDHWAQNNNSGALFYYAIPVFKNEMNLPQWIFITEIGIVGIIVVLRQHTTLQRKQKPFFQKDYPTFCGDFPIIDDIFKNIQQINDKIREFFNIENPYFILTPDIKIDLSSPCFGNNDFRIKIGSLALLFESEQKQLRKELGVIKPQKTITLMENFLKARNLSYNPLIFEIWRAIIGLRNNIPPYHRYDKEVLKFLKTLDIKPTDEPHVMWAHILKKFYQSLNSFSEIFEKIPYGGRAALLLN